MKIVKIFQLKIVFFCSREKSLYIAWACFRNAGGLNGMVVQAFVIIVK